MFQVLGFQKDWHEENQGSGLKLIFRWKWRFRCLQRLIRTQLAQLRFLSLLLIASNFASSSSFGRPVVSVECPHIQLVRIVWSIKILPGYAFAPWPHPWEEEGGDEERKGAQMETLQECETDLKSQYVKLKHESFWNHRNAVVHVLSYTFLICKNWPTDWKGRKDSGVGFAAKTEEKPRRKGSTNTPYLRYFLLGLLLTIIFKILCFWDDALCRFNIITFVGADLDV